MKNFLFTFLLILISSLALLSCSEDEECRLDRYVVSYANFYTVTTAETGEKSISQVAFDSLTVHGIGIDSLLYNKQVVNAVSLPLNKFSLLSEFIFDFNSIIDTVSIEYDTIMQFLSFECGYLVEYNITQVYSTNNYIDSVVINNSEVSTENVEHIKIYHTSQ